MLQGLVFDKNGHQLVSLPADMSFPDDVKEVVVRAVGVDRVLSPIDRVWDSFFDSKDEVTDDFMIDRVSACNALTEWSES